MRKLEEDLSKSGANKLYRLFQGSKKETDGSQQIKGTETLFWIKRQQVPTNKTSTYASVLLTKD